MSDEAPPPARPSPTPSWVMLGFVLGALFVWALPRRGSGPAAEKPPAAAQVAPPAAAPAARAPLTTVEYVFTEWSKYAVWDNDLTEVALWNPGLKDFSDCFEVLRVGDRYYFRSIPELTRPVLTHGAPVDPACPLQFTETVEQRQQWMGEKADESWRQLGKTMGNPPPPAPKP